MRTRSIDLAVLAVAACLFLSHSVWAQAVVPTNGLATPIGKVLSASGSVTIEHAAAVVLQANLPSDQLQAKVGDFVYQGDVVQTGPDAKAEITFTDGTAFNLSGNARMELNEFVYNPNSHSNASLFTLSKGTFTFVAGNMAKTGDMKIDTAIATVGIRGTTPHIEVSEDGKVKFSTLIEEKDPAAIASRDATQPRNGAARPARQRRSSAPPDPLTPQQESSYNRLFKLELEIVSGLLDSSRSLRKAVGSDARPRSWSRYYFCFQPALSRRVPNSCHPKKY